MKRFNDFFKKIFFPNDTKPNVKITDSIPDATLIINVYFNAVKKLSEIKHGCLKDLELFESKTSSTFLLEKIESVKSKILNESFDNINDESISRFLVMMQLKKELKETLNAQ